MPSSDRALWALRMWLDPWSGIGHAAVGMHRQATTYNSLSTMSGGGGQLPTPRGWSTHTNECDRHKLGENSVARGAAGSLGSVKENGSLDRWVGALELPRGQATDMQIVPIEAG